MYQLHLLMLQAQFQNRFSAPNSSGIQAFQLPLVYVYRRHAQYKKRQRKKNLMIAKIIYFVIFLLFSLCYIIHQQNNKKNFVTNIQPFQNNWFLYKLHTHSLQNGLQYSLKNLNQKHPKIAFNFKLADDTCPADIQNITMEENGLQKKSQIGANKSPIFKETNINVFSVQSAVQTIADVNCAQRKGNICLRCCFGAAFNNFGQCVILDSQCKSYDQITGLCKLCYSGYQLNNLNACIASSPEQVSDPLCAEWNNKICVRCSPGSFFGQSGECTQIDTSCKAANSLTGQCIGCYDGYKLGTDGSCVKHVEELSDLNCAQWNEKICVKCGFGATFNNVGRCLFLDTQCKQYDQITGKCRACYVGYGLDSSSTCVQSAIQDVKDPLCAQWYGDLCAKCSFGSYFNSQGICTQSDSSCKDFDQLTGKCLNCYLGYSLSAQYTCEKTADKQNINPLCAEWDESGLLCLRCSSGSYFNGLGLCQAVDPLCETSNALSGACSNFNQKTNNIATNYLNQFSKGALQSDHQPIKEKNVIEKKQEHANNVMDKEKLQGKNIKIEPASQKEGYFIKMLEIKIQ